MQKERKSNDCIPGKSYPLHPRSKASRVLPLGPMELAILTNSMFPVFLAMFTLIYLTGFSIVFRNWKGRLRPEASSCLTSLFHGTPAVCLAISAILTQPSPGFAASNTAAEKRVLDFSIAYFVVDLMHYLIFVPSEVLFIAHHLATLFVFITCRLVACHGAYGLLVIEVIAESTSFVQNVWTIAGMRRADSPSAMNVYKFLSVPFFTLYTAMRGVLAPLHFFKLSEFYLRGEASDVIPAWVTMSWLVVIGAGILVSLLWVANLWMQFFKERSQVKNTKES